MYCIDIQLSLNYFNFGLLINYKRNYMGSPRRLTTVSFYASGLEAAKMRNSDFLTMELYFSAPGYLEIWDGQK